MLLLLLGCHLLTTDGLNAPRLLGDTAAGPNNAADASMGKIEATVRVARALPEHEGKYRCNGLHDNYHYLHIVKAREAHRDSYADNNVEVKRNSWDGDDEGEEKVNVAEEARGELPSTTTANNMRMLMSLEEKEEEEADGHASDEEMKDKDEEPLDSDPWEGVDADYEENEYDSLEIDSSGDVRLKELIRTADRVTGDAAAATAVDEAAVVELMTNQSMGARAGHSVAAAAGGNGDEFPGNTGNTAIESDRSVDWRLSSSSLMMTNGSAVTDSVEREDAEGDLNGGAMELFKGGAPPSQETHNGELPGLVGGGFGKGCLEDRSSWNGGGGGGKDYEGNGNFHVAGNSSTEGVERSGDPYRVVKAEEGRNEVTVQLAGFNLFGGTAAPPTTALATDSVEAINSAPPPPPAIEHTNGHDNYGEGGGGGNADDDVDDENAGLVGGGVGVGGGDNGNGGDVVFGEKQYFRFAKIYNLYYFQVVESFSLSVLL